jgi:hypothetical protein
MQGGTVTAEDIKFKEKDWRTAVATKAGTTEQFSELRKAIIEGQEYVIQDETTVYFKTGSAVISASDKAHLAALAQKAPSLAIIGYPSSVRRPQGNAAANERLSLKRAGAVSNYLRQSGRSSPGASCPRRRWARAPRRRVRRRRPVTTKRVVWSCGWSRQRRNLRIASGASASRPKPTSPS